MKDIYISVIPGGYKIKCPEKSFSMRYYDYTKKQAIQQFRAVTALQNKHLNIKEEQSMRDINVVFSELAQYTRLQEETSAIIDGLKDEIKGYMNAAGLEVLTGNEHKASYKTVTASSINTAALKKDMPDIASKYTRTTQSKRFVFQ